MTTHEVINPATEQVVASVEPLDVEQTDEAIARARAAFAGWRAVAPGDRARLLRRFAEAVDADREHLAQLEVANSGHTISNARWEAGNARDVIAYYSGAPERLIGQQIPVADGIDVTFHEPLGVVGVIVPWNFPMPIASWGFAPALAAGNTRRAQAGRADAADRAAAGRAGARGGHPAGRVPGAARQGRCRRPAVRRPPGRRQDRLHRLDRGRPRRSWPAARQAHQAGHARTRRQERERGLRRRRPGGGGRRCAVRGLRQRRPGLLRPLAHPRRAQRLRPVHGAVRAGRQGRRGHRPGRREGRDGPADQRRAARAGRRATSRTTRRSRSAAARRTARGSGSRRPS